MRTYCTIITRDYTPFANVLYQSLARTDPDVKLQVLVANADEDLPVTNSPGLAYHPITSVLGDQTARGIHKKYAATNTDHFRWALKPVFMLHLLGDFEQVIFIDPDMYFIGAHEFLFAELDKHSILLAPHWSNTNPWKDEDGLYSVLRNGLYSGGFIGASRAGREAIQWWAEACHYKMEKVRELGLYDDQKYLDLLPVLDENCTLLRHKGCNLANINIETCKRQLVNSRLLINGEYEPVFIHFTRDTIHNIGNGNDPLLQPYLSSYVADLKNAGADTSIINGIPNSVFYAVSRKLLLRTRLKRFFYKLAEKL
jgi:hypothetical protein